MASSMIFSPASSAWIRRSEVLEPQKSLSWSSSCAHPVVPPADVLTVTNAFSNRSLQASMALSDGPAPSRLKAESRLPSSLPHVLSFATTCGIKTLRASPPDASSGVPARPRAAPEGHPLSLPTAANRSAGRCWRPGPFQADPAPARISEKHRRCCTHSELSTLGSALCCAPPFSRLLVSERSTRAPRSGLARPTRRLCCPAHDLGN